MAWQKTNRHYSFFALKFNSTVFFWVDFLILIFAVLMFWFFFAKELGCKALFT